MIICHLRNSGKVLYVISDLRLWSLMLYTEHLLFYLILGISKISSIWHHIGCTLKKKKTTQEIVVYTYYIRGPSVRQYFQNIPCWKRAVLDIPIRLSIIVIGHFIYHIHSNQLCSRIIYKSYKNHKKSVK